VIIISSGVLLGTVSFEDYRLSFLISAFTIVVAYLALPRQVKLRIGKRILWLAVYAGALAIIALTDPAFRELRARSWSRFYLQRVRIIHQEAPGTYVSFDICNNSNLPLDTVYFEVSGFVEGDTTARPLELVEGDRSRFRSDRFLPPSVCNVVKWPGPYLPFDYHRITVTRGSFRGVT
jgi:hypothetical protein